MSKKYYITDENKILKEINENININLIYINSSINISKRHDSLYINNVEEKSKDMFDRLDEIQQYNEIELLALFKNILGKIFTRISESYKVLQPSVIIGYFDSKNFSHPDVYINIDFLKRRIYGENRLSICFDEDEVEFNQNDIGCFIIELPKEYDQEN